MNGIKNEGFHRRNHSTSSFNVYHKFKFTELVQKSNFSIEMKISYTLFLIAMVAITMERCRAEYLLVAVDDDDFRKETILDDFGKTNDDDFSKRNVILERHK